MFKVFTGSLWFLGEVEDSSGCLFEKQYNQEGILLPVPEDQEGGLLDLADSSGKPAIPIIC